MRTLIRFTLAAALATLLTPMRLEAQCVVGAGLTVYNGSGVNPVGFSADSAIAGSIWHSTVALGPGSSGSMLFLGLGGVARPGWMPGGAFGRGELLCLPPLVQLDFSGSGNHSVFVPNTPNVIGMTFCAQAAVLRFSPGSGKTALVSLELQNALIVTIGYLDPFCCPNPACGG